MAACELSAMGQIGEFFHLPSHLSIGDTASLSYTCSLVGFAFIVWSSPKWKQPRHSLSASFGFPQGGPGDKYSPASDLSGK